VRRGDKPTVRKSHLSGTLEAALCTAFKLQGHARKVFSETEIVETTYGTG